MTGRIFLIFLDASSHLESQLHIWNSLLFLLMYTSGHIRPLRLAPLIKYVRIKMCGGSAVYAFII